MDLRRKIARHHSLLQELEESAHRLKYLLMDKDLQQDAEKEKEKSVAIKEEIGALEADLNLTDAWADRVRVGFIDILSSVRNSFNKIKSWGGYYPDLNQGMIIPGYLFGMILDDLRTCFLSAGEYYQPPHIYMSQKYWDVEVFLELIDNQIDELNKAQFLSPIEAINSYGNLKKNFFLFITGLRDREII